MTNAKKLTTAALRAMPVGREKLFAAKSGRAAAAARGLCSYYRMYEGRDAGVTLTSQWDKVNGVMVVKKLSL